MNKLPPVVVAAMFAAASFNAVAQKDVTTKGGGDVTTKGK